MPNDDIDITITLGERDLLLKETIAIDEDILAKIRIAEVVGASLRFSLTLDDLDLLLDGIAAEANHAKSKKMQRAFDSLYDRLAKIFDHHVALEKAQAGLDDESPAGLTVVGPSRFTEELFQLMQQQLVGFFQSRLADYFDVPKRKLGGLGPDQALALCQEGWWGDDPPIRLNTDIGLADLAGSRFLNNARLLLTSLHDAGGASLTAKENLTRKFVADMLDRLELEDGYKEELLKYNKVVNERDFNVLHILRLVCELAKLVRKNKKRLVATKLGLSLLADERAGQLFAKLFDAQFTKFNLAYFDRLPDDSNTLQGIFPYILYRLSLLETGKEYAIGDLPKLLLPPSLVKDLDSTTDWTKSDRYLLIRVIRPLEQFGMLTTSRPKTALGIYETERYVRKTDLFGRFIDNDRLRRR